MGKCTCDIGYIRDEGRCRRPQAFSSEEPSVNATTIETTIETFNVTSKPNVSENIDNSGNGNGVTFFYVVEQ